MANFSHRPDPQFKRISSIQDRTAARWTICFCLAVLVGCAQSKLEDPAKVVPVNGKVLFKGQPIAGAQLSFHRQGEGESAFGLTDAQGKFTGMTNDANGMFPGEYRVTMTHPSLKFPSKYGDLDRTPWELILLEQESGNELLLQIDD